MAVGRLGAARVVLPDQPPGRHLHHVDHAPDPHAHVKPAAGIEHHAVGLELAAPDVPLVLARKLDEHAAVDGRAVGRQVIDVQPVPCALAQAQPLLIGRHGESVGIRQAGVQPRHLPRAHVVAVDRPGRLLGVGIARVAEVDVACQVQGHVVDRVEVLPLPRFGQHLDALAVRSDPQQPAGARVAGDQPALAVDLQPVGLGLGACNRGRLAQVAEHPGRAIGADPADGPVVAVVDHVEVACPVQGRSFGELEPGGVELRLHGV